jgi:hypothetical protein
MEIENIEYTTIQISAKIYGGFQYKIPTELFNKMSYDDVIKETKIYMKNFFKTYKLYELCNNIDDLSLHMHDDLYSKKIRVLCDNCH